MITNHGAANEFTVDHLNLADNWQHVERAQIFYVPVQDFFRIFLDENLLFLGIFHSHLFRSSISTS